MNEVEAFEKSMQEFFLNTKDFQRKFASNSGDRLMRPNPDAIKLMQDFDQVKKEVHACLSDNFNTVGAMQKFKELVSIANIYTAKQAKVTDIHISLLEDVAKYLTKMFKIFGVIADHVHTEIGFENQAAVGGNANSAEASDQPTCLDILDVLSEYRENVRSHSRNKDITAVLKASDDLRDNILPEIGVRLEDTDKGARVKIVGKIQALKEKEAKLKELAEKEEKKRQKAEAARKLAEEKNLKNSIPEYDMFKLEQHLKTLNLTKFVGKFTQFGEDGKPTHEKCEKSEEFPDGEKPISKSTLKNVEKAYKNQVKNHAAWRKEQTEEHLEWLDQQRVQ